MRIAVLLVTRRHVPAVIGFERRTRTIAEIDPGGRDRLEYLDLTRSVGGAANGPKGARRGHAAPAHRRHTLGAIPSRRRSACQRSPPIPGPETRLLTSDNIRLSLPQKTGYRRLGFDFFSLFQKALRNWVSPQTNNRALRPQQSWSLDARCPLFC